MTDAEHAEHIRQLVDEAPPLTEMTRARLATLLRPATPANAGGGVVRQKAA